MKTKDIALFGLLALGGFAAYKYFGTPTPPAGYNGANYIPAGSAYNGYLNTTGQPVWLQAVNGTASIVNALGQVLSTIPWASVTNNNSGANSNPFYEPDTGQPSAF